MTLKPDSCPMCGRWPDKNDLRVEIGSTAPMNTVGVRDDYFIIAWIQCPSGDGCRCGGPESYFDLDATPEELWEESVKSWNQRSPPEPEDDS